jgi:tetratricopeptide (TPR) repeat protein
MTLPFTLALGLLIVALISSVYLAYSGILVGRAYIGWIYVVIYLLIYFPFAVAWYRDLAAISVTTILHVTFLVLLILPLGALATETIVETFWPDRSKGLRIMRFYTRAEEKVIEDDLPGAIEEYEKVIAEDPDDLRARLRMAELCAEAEQYDKAVATYEVILTRSEELGKSQHCTVLTRLSDIYSRHLFDVHRARENIQAIIDRYPDSSYADFARERLARL